MAERLTISSGEITFYADTYNKCSNKNSNEVKSKVEKSIPYYAIKEYKYKQYNTDELSEMYSKLSKLEDIMEKYGIDSVEELDKQLANGVTWQEACELACEREDDCYVYDNIHRAYEFYQQAKTEGNDERD